MIRPDEHLGLREEPQETYPFVGGRQIVSAILAVKRMIDQLSFRRGWGYLYRAAEATLKLGLVSPPAGTWQHELCVWRLHSRISDSKCLLSDSANWSRRIAYRTAMELFVDHQMFIAYTPPNLFLDVLPRKTNHRESGPRMLGML